MSEENGADVDLKLAGQEVKLKNVKSLNTIVCIAILVILCAVIPAAWSMFKSHADETKEASKELSGAMREMTQATREQNCLIAQPQELRVQNSDWCKRLAR